MNMEESELQIGDVAVIRSDKGDTPRLTISKIDGKYLVCTWFDGQTFKQTNFHPHDLRKVKV